MFEKLLWIHVFAPSCVCIVIHYCDWRTAQKADYINEFNIGMTNLGSKTPQGQQLVNQAVQRGHQVTVMVRPSSKKEFPAGVKVIKGEVSDEQVVAQAVQGQEAVLIGLGHILPNLFPWSQPKEYLADALNGVVAAMQKTGVKKISFVSAAGVGESWNHIPFGMKFFIQASALRHVFPLMNKAEDVIIQSGLDYQINHPMILTDKPLSSKKAQIVQDASGFNLISRADVAEFMLDQVEKPEFSEKYPIILSGA